MRNARVPIALIALSVAARLVSLHALHPLNWDEIEFFRATDWVRQGLVPYRDFWEHHTPLQWFLFAPVTAFLHSPGAASIIAMRWAQLPLWIATFALVDVWMRDAGVSRFARWCALAIPLTSSFFMIPAVEYRVDVLGIALLVAGLVLLQRAPRGIRFALGAGAAFALAGFANLRLGPALVLIMLLARVVRLTERRWGGEPRVNWVFAGAAITTAIGATYFLATHSLRDAIRHVWTENYVADRLAENVSGIFLHRLVAPFGFRLLRPSGEAAFTPSGIDPGGILLLVVVTIAIVRIIMTRRREPDAFLFLSFAFLVNALFIGAMKFVFTYHLEVLAVLAVPLLAFELERIDRRVVVALLIVTSLTNAAVAVFRGKEDDLRYQNAIMAEADRRTPAGSTVFDSAGWALHRQPAYRYWFLREIVRVLVANRTFEPYTAQQLLAQPPAAIIADHDLRLWLYRNPALGVVATTHYLPSWRDLWLPGLSARIAPGTAQERIVPADGEYRVFASERLANHPWFPRPLDFSRPWPQDVALRDSDTSRDVAFFVDRQPVPLMKSLSLRKGAHVVIANGGKAPLGVMLVRGDPADLFRQPPRGVTIEASFAPQWHVPRLR